jgi:hypothetical protein
MTAIKFVPLSLDVATRTLVVLREVRRATQDEFGDPTYLEASELTKVFGEAISIAGEHVPASELLCAELLELIGRVTGRPISTIPGPSSLAEATAALEDMAPVLGGTVLRLPPRPERETEQAIEAATTRALADMPGPISLRPFVVSPRGHLALDAVDRWAVPRKGERWGGYLVLDVDWDGAGSHSACLFLQAKPPEDIDF